MHLAKGANYLEKTQVQSSLPVHLFVILVCILFLNGVSAFCIILSYFVSWLSTVSVVPQKWIDPLAVKDLVNSIAAWNSIGCTRLLDSTPQQS